MFAILTEIRDAFDGVESGSEAVRYHMRKKFTNDDLHLMIESLYNVFY